MSWLTKKTELKQTDPPTRASNPPPLTEAQGECAHTWHIPGSGQGPVLCIYCGADRAAFQAVST